MAKFQVYFEQINQSCVEVEAKTVDEAVEKATSGGRKKATHDPATFKIWTQKRVISRGGYASIFRDTPTCDLITAILLPQYRGGNHE